MSSIRIKICGITSAEDAALCVRAGADYLGFIFHPDSPRAVTPETAGEIVRGLPPHVTPVGVFVNPGTARLERIARISGVRVVQLAGDESPEFCAEVRQPVIKVVHPGRGRPPGDYRVFSLMVDGGRPGEYGGTGRAADYRFAASCSSLGRCFVAGGLDHNNVRVAISRTTPFGVDAASGTEHRPGVKDPVKVQEFCRAVKEFNIYK